MKWSLTIITLLVVGLNGCASINNLFMANKAVRSEPKLPPAEALKKGKDSEQRSKYADAVRFYLIAAKQGNMNAEIRLGNLYREGHEGVKRDLTSSASWFLKAARQGNALAQFETAEIYYSGKGFKRDYRKSLKWYKAAAINGNIYAMTSLAYMYLRGKGVDKDVPQAIKWFYSAANDPAWKNISSDENPSNEARLALASIYESGEGGAKDVVRAFGLIEAASDHASVAGKIELAKHYMQGAGVAKDLPAAIQLLSQLPENGNHNEEAVMASAVLQAVVEGEKAYKEMKYKEALRNLKAAAVYGDAKAQDLVGNMYFGGAGIPKDSARAIGWWKKAASQGNLKAIASLGVSYWIGAGGLPANRDEAIKYLLYAAKGGNKHARYVLETFAFPKWHYVTASHDYIGLIRRDRIRKYRGNVMFWVMSVSAPEAINDGYHFSGYSKTLYKATCVDRVMGIQRIIDYASGGKPTHSRRYSSIDMQPVASGSTEEGYLKYACSFANN